jgi:DNA-binding NtrC family response regulator
MNAAVTLKERVDVILKRNSSSRAEHARSIPTVLIATIDPAIRNGLTELFQGLSLQTIWMQGVEAAKSVLRRENVSACLCGFWLQDGTYRELIRHIKRERMEIPTIIVSPPACPEEYGEYLAATNIGALDFLGFPYRKRDLERMLRVALEPLTQSAAKQSSTIDSAVRVVEAA